MAGSCERATGKRAAQEPRDSAGLTEAEFLAKYRTIDYPKAEPTADAVVFHQVDTRDGAARQGERAAGAALEVLLVRRGGHPYLGCWAVPGGFVNPDEDADRACARELEEETGLSGIPFEQLGFYSTPGRDPRGWVVSSAYVALIAGRAEPEAGDDAACARWFTIEEDPAYADGAADGSVATTSATNAKPHPTAPADDMADGSAVSTAGMRCHLLRLACGQDELTIAFTEVAQPFSAPRARIVEAQGLAFDHGRMIADAWLRIGGR